MPIYRHMESFNRIKKINGKEYVYEIQPYYDKKTKTIRQKSKYLGIHLGDLENPYKQKDLALPKKVLDYGEYVPFLSIINELKLEEILEKINKNFKEILTISLNKIINPLALVNIKSWCEGNILSKKYGSLSLSSQNITKILRNIKNKDTKNLFCKEFIKNVKSEKTLFYDITSFSSYSKMLKLLEYGYNRDKKNLPQFNLSLIVDKESQMPLFYDVYPGSIPDSKTIYNTIAKMKELDLNEPLLVLDRGFFNRDIIFNFIEEKIDFLIGATTQLKVMETLFKKECLEIENPNNLKKFNGKIIFSKEISVKIKDKDDKKECVLFGFLYYDPSRADREKIVFYEILYSYLDQMKLKNITLNKIDEISGKYSKYFMIKNKKLVFNENEIKNRLDKMGAYIILSNKKQRWDESLSLYKSKDMIEKGFHLLKNYFGSLPSRLQDEDTLEGLVFVMFLALIIQMKLLQKMRTSKLIEKYSVEKLIIELHKIKKIKFGEKLICSEITKKQREILDKLKCCA